RKGYIISAKDINEKGLRDTILKAIERFTPAEATLQEKPKSIASESLPSKETVTIPRQREEKPAVSDEEPGKKTPEKPGKPGPTDLIILLVTNGLLAWRLCTKDTSVQRDVVMAGFDTGNAIIIGAVIAAIALLGLGIYLGKDKIAVYLEEREDRKARGRPLTEGEREQLTRIARERAAAETHRLPAGPPSYVHGQAATQEEAKPAEPAKKPEVKTPAEIPAIQRVEAELRKHIKGNIINDALSNLIYNLSVLHVLLLKEKKDIKMIAQARKVLHNAKIKCENAVKADPGCIAKSYSDLMQKIADIKNKHSVGPGQKTAIERLILGRSLKDISARYAEIVRAADSILNPPKKEETKKPEGGGTTPKTVPSTLIFALAMAGMIPLWIAVAFVSAEVAARNRTRLAAFCHSRWDNFVNRKEIRLKARLENALKATGIKRVMEGKALEEAFSQINKRISELRSRREKYATEVAEKNKAAQRSVKRIDQEISAINTFGDILHFVKDPEGTMPKVTENPEFKEALLDYLNRVWILKKAGIKDEYLAKLHTPSYYYKVFKMLLPTFEGKVGNLKKFNLTVKPDLLTYSVENITRRAQLLYTYGLPVDDTNIRYSETKIPKEALKIHVETIITPWITKAGRLELARLLDKILTPSPEAAGEESITTKTGEEYWFSREKQAAFLNKLRNRFVSQVRDGKLFDEKRAELVYFLNRIQEKDGDLNPYLIANLTQEEINTFNKLSSEAIRGPESKEISAYFLYRLLQQAETEAVFMEMPIGKELKSLKEGKTVSSGAMDLLGLLRDVELLRKHTQDVLEIARDTAVNYAHTKNPALLRKLRKIYDNETEGINSFFTEQARLFDNAQDRFVLEVMAQEGKGLSTNLPENEVAKLAIGEDGKLDINKLTRLARKRDGSLDLALILSLCGEDIDTVRNVLIHESLIDKFTSIHRAMCYLFANARPSSSELLKGVKSYKGSQGLLYRYRELLSDTAMIVTGIKNRIVNLKESLEGIAGFMKSPVAGRVFVILLAVFAVAVVILLPAIAHAPSVTGLGHADYTPEAMSIQPDSAQPVPNMMLQVPQAATQPEALSIAMDIRGPGLKAPALLTESEKTQQKAVKVPELLKDIPEKAKTVEKPRLPQPQKKEAQKAELKPEAEEKPVVKEEGKPALEGSITHAPVSPTTSEKKKAEEVKRAPVKGPLSVLFSLTARLNMQDRIKVFEGSVKRKIETIKIVPAAFQKYANKKIRMSEYRREYKIFYADLAAERYEEALDHLDKCIEIVEGLVNGGSDDLAAILPTLDKLRPSLLTKCVAGSTARQENPQRLYNATIEQYNRFAADYIAADKAGRRKAAVAYAGMCVAHLTSLTQKDIAAERALETRPELDKLLEQWKNLQTAQQKIIDAEKAGREAQDTTKTLLEEKPKPREEKVEPKVDEKASAKEIKSETKEKPAGKMAVTGETTLTYGEPSVLAKPADDNNTYLMYPVVGGDGSKKGYVIIVSKGKTEISELPPLAKMRYIPPDMPGADRAKEENRYLQYPLIPVIDTHGEEIGYVVVGKDIDGKVVVRRRILAGEPQIIEHFQVPKQGLNIDYVDCKYILEAKVRNGKVIGYTVRVQVSPEVYGNPPGFSPMPSSGGGGGSNSGKIEDFLRQLKAAREQGLIPSSLPIGEQIRALKSLPSPSLSPRFRFAPVYNKFGLQEKPALQRPPWLRDTVVDVTFSSPKEPVKFDLERITREIRITRPPTRNAVDVDSVTGFGERAPDELRTSIKPEEIKESTAYFTTSLKKHYPKLSAKLASEELWGEIMADMCEVSHIMPDKAREHIRGVAEWMPWVEKWIIPRLRAMEKKWDVDLTDLLHMRIHNIRPYQEIYELQKKYPDLPLTLVLADFLQSYESDEWWMENIIFERPSRKYARQKTANFFYELAVRNLSGARSRDDFKSRLDDLNKHIIEHASADFPLWENRLNHIIVLGTTSIFFPNEPEMLDWHGILFDHFLNFTTTQDIQVERFVQQYTSALLELGPVLDELFGPIKLSDVEQWKINKFIAGSPTEYKDPTDYKRTLRRILELDRLLKALRVILEHDRVKAANLGEMSNEDVIKVLDKTIRNPKWINFLKNEVMPRMKDKSGKFREEFKAPLFDALGYANRHTLPFAKEADGITRSIKYADDCETVIAVIEKKGELLYETRTDKHPEGSTRGHTYISKDEEGYPIVKEIIPLAGGLFEEKYFFDLDDSGRPMREEVTVKIDGKDKVIEKTTTEKLDDGTVVKSTTWVMPDDRWQQVLDIGLYENTEKDRMRAAKIHR
ncbi:MAG: hypothetical protein JW994_03515, partial [Candidatus Omnitrophica bacterium]|nr:hypothetical protein [Candidatus Omnitrophota bacterium]